MAGWLKKATAGWGRTEAPPAPYRVACDCGATLTGVRAALPQKPACPVCGSPVFVLPNCVYPLPKSCRAEPPAEPVRPAAPPKSVRSRTPTRAASAAAEPAFRETRPRSRFLTPVRVIVAVIGCVIVLTGAVVWRRAQIEQARRNLPLAIERGAAAFAERDFVAAADAYRQAQAALDLLGRNDAAARYVRQCSLEASAASGLAAVGLSDVILQSLSDKGGDSAVERFGRQYAGAWIVCDARLSVLPDADEKRPRRYQVDLPLALDAHAVEIELSDVPWRAFLADAGAQPRRVVFAAQLEELQPPTELENAVRLQLRGATAVLWSSYGSYRAIGFESGDGGEDPELRSVLAEQRAFLGAGE